VRPEHLEARKAWRANGMSQLATNTTPLGVAVLHNHAEVGTSVVLIK
jgi:hypothetical protein